MSRCYGNCRGWTRPNWIGRCRTPHPFAKTKENTPAYLQVSRGGLTLHLSEHHGDCCPGSTVFVWMTGIDEFHREITGKNYKYLRPGMEPTFYDAWCVEVIDPFGNRIRFNEDLKPGKTT